MSGPGTRLRPSSRWGLGSPMGGPTDGQSSTRAARAASVPGTRCRCAATSTACSSREAAMGTVVFVPPAPEFDATYESFGSPVASALLGRKPDDPNRLSPYFRPALRDQCPPAMSEPALNLFAHQPVPPGAPTRSPISRPAQGARPRLPRDGDRCWSSRGRGSGKTAGPSRGGSRHLVARGGGGRRRSSPSRSRNKGPAEEMSRRVAGARAGERARGGGGRSIRTCAPRSSGGGPPRGAGLAGRGSRSTTAATRRRSLRARHQVRSAPRRGR